MMEVATALPITTARLPAFGVGSGRHVCVESVAVPALASTAAGTAAESHPIALSKMVTLADRMAH